MENMEINTIHTEDCIHFMEKMKNENVDLVVADPPYNLKKNFGNKSDHWDTVND